LNRRALLVAALLAPLWARAQPTKLARIGVLWPVGDDATLEAFRQGMRQLGYREGQNMLIEYRFARGKDELLPQLAADLVNQKVDVLVTWGVVAARAATRATSTIPIVNGSMSDPVRAGLVPSLSRPGGNLTGLTSLTPDLSAKRLELVRELMPRVSRVAVLTTANPTAVLGLQETERAAHSLGVPVRAVSIRDAAEFDTAFTAMAAERVDAVIVLADMLFIHHAKRLIELSEEHRLPAVYFSRDHVEAGGLLAYSASFADMFRRTAVYVDKILKGAKAGELPIERPTKFDLAINRRAAANLGLAIPQSILLRADKVIE
jgi:putative ABC transport system substrate-binding protein